MKKFKLTKSKVDSLPLVSPDMLNSKGNPIKQIDYFDADLPGFGIRVSSKKKTYFVMRRVKGKLSRVTVGIHGEITADQARKEARGKLYALSEGSDLNKQKARDRAAKISLGEVLDKYIEDKTLRPNTVLDYRKVLRLYVSDWLKKPMIDITSAMIEARHKKIKNKVGPIPANKLARYIRLLYNYAIKTPSIDLDLAAHPVIVQWGEEKRRKTYVTPSQLPVWVQAVKKLPNPMMQDFFMLLLYTGLRKNEALSLEWCNVDLDEGYFVIPGDVAKNKDDHYLPITRQLREIFERREAMRENEFIFPGTGQTRHLVEPRKQSLQVTHETQKILNDVKTEPQWKKFLEETPERKIKPGIKFTNHDIRRTLASIAEDLVSYSQMKRFLNHATANDVTQGYIILDADRLRGPAQRIADEIDALSMGRNGKVVPLRRTAE